MKGSTHFVVGIASALAITHPQTVTGVITAMTSGAIGGWIVDIDVRNRESSGSDETKREKFYDAIIDTLFILAFIVVDFFIGKGMCQYVIDNWGIVVEGALFGILITLLIGFNTTHRTFTHSFLAMAIFTALMYFFCRPAAIPFLIGYASHLVADLFNKRGPQLFFPFKWKPCFKLCKSDDRKVNGAIFWVSLAISVALGAYLFSKNMTKVYETSDFINVLTSRKIFGLNTLQIYLIFINVLTFLGFQRNHRKFVDNVWDAYERGVEYDDEDYDTPELRFEVWLLDFLAFIGGGLGMFVSLVINLELPKAYNGVWWAFCYTSILFWFTVYCYVCNPFGYSLGEINWLSTSHFLLYVYVLGINVVSALVLFSLRNRSLEEDSFWHTTIFLLGALGGTISSIPMVFYINRKGTFFFAVMGFMVMLISQIVFVMYMLSAGVV